MSDLIDRQDAKDVVDMELDAIDHVPEWVYDRLLTALDKAPSAQPEITRCKDCKRYNTDKCFIKIQMLWELMPNDYCSYAERGKG